MGAYEGIGQAIVFFAQFAVFSFFTLLTAAVLFILSFTPLWTPWFYLAFIVSTAVVTYINTQIAK